MDTVTSGYAYHIKDDFFAKVHDNKLMSNKEDGSFRPTFYCEKDTQTGLLWMIPLSTKYEKFKKIHDKTVKKYGNCLGIVLGKYDKKDAAFLLQNMFPITEDYIDHIHTKNGQAIPVSHSIQEAVRSNMVRLRKLTSCGKKVVFTDIIEIERKMLEELKEKSISISTSNADEDDDEFEM